MSSVMNIVDQSGDTKYIWDSDNEDEIAAAQAAYEKLIKKNYIAYTVDADGEQGRKIHRFDPSLGKIILIPPIVGG